ncbi:MAG: DinB family protein [Candidatus Bathyarchaeota archaeon]|jgi:hypothetical protein
MNIIDTLIGQLRATFDGRAWHGPSFMYTLEGVDEAQARARPIKGRHTIWEIVDHTRYWAETERGAIQGSEMPNVSTVKDWFPMREEAWEDSKARLQAEIERLIEAMEGMDVSDLTEIVTGREYTFMDMLYGLVHHNLYHAGQIAILNKPENNRP